MTADELHRAGRQPDPFNEQSAAPKTSHLITHTHEPYFCIPCSAASRHAALSTPSRSNKKLRVTSIQMSPPPPPPCLLLFSPPLPSLTLSSLPCSNLWLFPSSTSSPDAASSHRGDHISPHSADIAPACPIKTLPVNCISPK